MANSKLPADPVILLSYVNTKLRDEFDSLSELCKGLNTEETQITKQLEAIGYLYDPETNRFR